MRKIIDINCDLGEGIGNEESILPFISSANIACGYHAGDEETIRKTIAACLKHNVVIGAHPSFEDKENFGRSELDLPDEEVYLLVKNQIQLMIRAANDAGSVLSHVKPHGALYNMASRDAALAAVIVSAIVSEDKKLILYGLSGSQLIAEGKKAGLQVAGEAFADRTYQDDGSLTPRSNPRALIEVSEEAVRQVLQLIHNGTVNSLNGKVIPMEADTICIHGDGPHAISFAKAIQERLVKEGIQVHRNIEY